MLSKIYQSVVDMRYETWGPEVGSLECLKIYEVDKVRHARCLVVDGRVGETRERESATGVAKLERATISRDTSTFPPVPPFPILSAAALGTSFFLKGSGHCAYSFGRIDPVGDSVARLLILALTVLGLGSLQSIAGGCLREVVDITSNRRRSSQIFWN